MNKVSLLIFKLFLKRNNNESVRIKRMLAALNPGKSQDILFQNYCLEKIKKTLLLSFAMVVLIISVLISEYTTQIIDEEGKLGRESVLGNDYKADLTAQIDNEEVNVEVNVKKQKLTKQDVDNLYCQFAEILDELIIGNNVSMDYISEKMNLVNSIEGYPFYCRWESGNYDLLHENGEIVEDKLIKEGTKVELKCVCSYEEYQYERNYIVKVFPKEMSPTEKMKDEIIASIQDNQEETQYKEYLQLPLSVGNKEIIWKKSSSCAVAVMAILSLVAIIGVWFGVDNDLTSKYKNRDQLLRLDYSEFVSKLQLLISSGMTLRGALERMEADYKITLQRGEKTKYVYEELSICLKRLRDGASETEVYMMFGNRCGLMLYKKLMSLLSQNLKKGSSGLIDSLSYESKSAFEERKHLARRMGEEAQTKLLLPMIMMLSVVMVIIMVPAYFSFAM